MILHCADPDWHRILLWRASCHESCLGGRSVSSRFELRGSSSYLVGFMLVQAAGNFTVSKVCLCYVMLILVCYVMLILVVIQ